MREGSVVMRALSAIGVALLVAVAVAQPAEAARPKANSCALKGSKTVARSPDVRVFTAPGRSEGRDVVRLYGCRKANGRKQALAEAWDDDYTTSNDFGTVRLSGRFVAWHETSVDVSCKADCPPAYDGTNHSIELHDLVSRRRVRSVIAEPEAMVLTRRGGVAWRDDGKVFAVDRSGQRTLDSGPISRLRAEISIVSWLNGGVERFARLGPPR